MKTIGEALAETMSLATPLAATRTLLSEARGRFLAERTDTSLDVPRFDASVVDGYAVRASEIKEGARLTVVGEARAGGEPPVLVREAAMRIFTGAPVPRGADAVVMQEVVTREGDQAIFERRISAGAGIRRRASDLCVGETLLDAGAELDAGALGLLASQGHDHVVVHRVPSVSILTTGDEVFAAGATLSPGGLYDSNGPMLDALVSASGARLGSRVHVRDDLDELTAALDRSLGSDVVITVGGVSVGDHDLVHAALARLGVERRLWRVRMKPGKPLAVGTRGKSVVIGLPGNPVSAWVCFEVFVRPLLARMLGDPRPYRRVIDVTLGASVRASPDRTELARARIDEEGVAWPMATQGSSALTSVTNVHALLVLPERDEEILAGERVQALLLSGPGAVRPPFVV